MEDRPIKIIADAPSKSDLLGYSSYINALFKIIKAENTFTPFNIGILGEWGTGKSTLMMQLASKLNSDNFPVVIFNPWKYDGKEEIIHALIQTVLISFEKQETTKEIKEIAKEISKGLGQMVVSKIISAATFNTIDFDKTLDIYTQKKEENIKFINEFETTFTELVNRYAGNKKLVIFIDDLDRCLPDNIIKILEAVKLFLSVPKCIFIIGIDNIIIQEAISEKYGKNYTFSGKDYLEKIIQLSFSIPDASQKNIEEFAHKICGGLINSEVIKLIVCGCRSNPRRIKRFINSFNLIAAIIDEEIKYETQIVRLNKELLSFVLLMQIQFIAAYNYYQNNIKDFSDLLHMLNQKKYYEKEQINGIGINNPSYLAIIENKEFVEFIKKASILDIIFELGDEGLSEYFSVTKSISIENEPIDNYYVPEILKGKHIKVGVGNDLYLISVGHSKLNVVKSIKDISGLGLKEVKEKVDWVSNGNGPLAILENVSHGELNEYKKIFEKLGAVVEYR